MAQLPDKERATKDLQAYEEKWRASTKKIDEMNREKNMFELKLHTLQMQNDSYQQGITYFAQVLSNLENKIEQFEYNINRAQVAIEYNKNKLNELQPKLTLALPEQFYGVSEKEENNSNYEHSIQTKNALEEKINENNQVIEKLTKELFEQ